MTRTLRAMPTLMRVGLAEAMAYRAELLVWVLTTTMPLVMLPLWQAVAETGPLHGYTGDVYYTNGAASLDVGAPAGNQAFYLYVEPNPFALIEFEITTAAGSVTESISGSSGAAGYGFCCGVDNINVRTTDGFTDFAVGEFGVAN